MQRRHGLYKKISTIVRKAGLPRYARLGPWKFTSTELVLGLAIRARWARTYCATIEFLDEYYGIHVH